MTRFTTAGRTSRLARLVSCIAILASATTIAQAAAHSTHASHAAHSSHSTRTRSAHSGDTTLVYAGQHGKYTVYMTADAVRIDGNGSGWQLFRKSDPAVVSVDPAHSSYTRLDKDNAAQIRHEMDGLRARIEEQLQQLPPQQRPAARAAMNAKVPGMDGKDHSVGVESTGSSDSVAGVKCDVVQIVRDGQPADRMCVASASALGISTASFATVKSMFSTLQGILKGTGLEGIGLPYQSLSGMPVRFVDSISGERRTLASVSHADIPASRFTIPSSYISQQPTMPGQ